MRIAFYAPLKAPTHPVPSGDRKIARLFIAALQRCGHEVMLASDLRAWSATADPARHAALQAEAAGETDVLIARFSGGGEAPPDLWFTYHPYYKAPDLIGPKVTRALAIPYVTAEASYAAKRDRDQWASWQADVIDALRLAALNICMTPVDREAVDQLVGADRIADLPPFIDVEEQVQPVPPAYPASFSATRPLLATVAMMRPGDKLKSYQMLGEVLASLQHLDWSLAIVGDGTERAAVEQEFRQLPPQRVAFCGLAEPAAVAGYLKDADIYVWPGFGEAYGLSFLEAQLAGLPVVAMRAGGIASVVEDGRTGLLTPPGDREAFAAALAQLIGDAAMRATLGKSARAFVVGERALAPAARKLDGLLRAVLAKSPASIP